MLLCARVVLAEEYKPVRAGGFMLTPKLMIEQVYTDNVYASVDKESDHISMIKPSLLIEKSYRDHEFELETGGEARRYWSNSDESVINFKTEFRGTVTARRVLMLPFKMSYESGHFDRREERGELTREPTGFKLLKTEIGADYAPSRLGLGFYAGYSQSRFENGETFSGVSVVNEDGDYDSLYARMVARYKTKADWTPFASLQLGRNDFLRRTHDGTGFNGPERDNHVIRALAGAEYDDHKIWKGSAAIGHEWRKYDGGGIEDIGALSAESKIDWMPSRKLKLSFDFLRRTEEDSTADNGIVETDAGLSFNYELRHNLFLQGGAEWERAQFDAADRTDDTYGGRIGLLWALNSRLEAGASYLHRYRESSAASDFDENIFLLRLTGKL
ncbi:MAG: outer membrane beta-barrel protein [Alphaproteobacteria bacterium]